MYFSGGGVGESTQFTYDRKHYYLARTKGFKCTIFKYVCFNSVPSYVKNLKIHTDDNLWYKYTSVKEYPGFFQFQAIINKTSVNTVERVSLQ